VSLVVRDRNHQRSRDDNDRYVVRLVADPWKYRELQVPDARNRNSWDESGSCYQAMDSAHSDNRQSTKSMRAASFHHVVPMLGQAIAQLIVGSVACT
jgi:hypothetical protein